MNHTSFFVYFTCFFLGLVLFLLAVKPEPLPDLQALAYGLPELTLVKSPVPVVKEEWFLTNVSEIIKIKTPEDIEEKRKELIGYIWKGRFPTAYPTEIRKNIDPSTYTRLPGIQSVDLYEISQKGTASSVYHFKTNKNKKKNKLIIFHIGSKIFEDDSVAGRFLPVALQAGFDVLLVSSPLSTLKPEFRFYYSDIPVFLSSQFGALGLTDQNVFFLIEDAAFSPLQLYLDPLALSLNYIDEHYEYDSYHLLGISDGSWEGVVYPAIDPRIKTSMVLDPPLPFFIATNRASASLRNYEYLHPQFSKIANYPELYVMASYGEGRIHSQFLDLANPKRQNEQVDKAYTQVITARVKMLGKGIFDTFILDMRESDDSTSVLFLSRIFSNIEEKEIAISRVDSYGKTAT